MNIFNTTNATLDVILTLTLNPTFLWWKLHETK